MVGPPQVESYLPYLPATPRCLAGQCTDSPLYNNDIDNVARTWGSLAAYAEERGRPRPQNDMWVAACCIYYDLPTLNIKDFRDFAEYEGLTIIAE